MDFYENEKQMRMVTRQIALDRELFEMNQQHVRQSLDEKSHDAKNVGQMFRTVERKSMTEKYRSARLRIPFQLREFDL